MKLENLANPLSNPQQIIHSDLQSRASISSFFQKAIPQLEQLRGQDNYLKRLFKTVDSIGTDYANQAVNRLDKNQFKTEKMIEIIEARNYGSLESDPHTYTIAIDIGRKREAIKRHLLSREILANGESLSNVEQILLLGGLALSHQSDIVFFDEWRPLIKDSDVGRELRKMEDKEEGSSLTILPGIPSDTRWFIREVIDPNKPLSKDNIRLVHYKDSLPTVLNVVETLTTMVSLLENEVKEGGNDFGYIKFLKAWVDCLSENNPQSQKQREDRMMIAWRKINPNAPVFMVPWAEYLDDPSSILINPGLRLGVIDNSEEALSSEHEEIEIRNLIIDYIVANGISGKEAVEAITSIHAVWTGYAGFDLTLGIASQVLPNDTYLRRDYGAYVLPDPLQSKRGAVSRKRLAKKVYPNKILKEIDILRFNDVEASVNEMAAHEFFHPVGVNKEGEDALGKVREHFEEPKATLGGLLVQSQNKGRAFKTRALATLMHSAPRYLSLDGKPSYQGYANISRISLAIAEKFGIISYDDSSGFKLDLVNQKKLDLFWEEVAKYIRWCTDAYKDEVFTHLGDKAWEEIINQQRQKYKEDLDQWTELGNVGVEIKKRLESS